MKMLARIRFLAFGLVLGTLSGCAFDAPPGGPGTGGTDGGTGGISTGGSASGGAPAAGGASTGGNLECFQPIDSNSIGVVLTNYTGHSIYIGQNTVTCDEAPLFKVFREGGDEVVPAASCDHVCGRLPGCGLPCLFPSALSLGPNESAKLLYDATDYVPSLQPGNCEDAGECLRATKLAAGYYTFMMAAGAAVDCSDTTITCGDCEPAASGGCTVPAAVVPFFTFSAQATAWLDPAGGTSETVFLDIYDPTNAPD